MGTQPPPPGANSPWRVKNAGFRVGMGLAHISRRRRSVKRRLQRRCGAEVRACCDRLHTSEASAPEAERRATRARRATRPPRPPAAERWRWSGRSGGRDRDPRSSASAAASASSVRRAGPRCAARVRLRPRRSLAAITHRPRRRLTLRGRSFEPPAARRDTGRTRCAAPPAILTRRGRRRTPGGPPRPADGVRCT